MLSKVFKNVSRASAFRQSVKRFGNLRRIVNDVLYRDDKNDSDYITATYDPRLPLANFSAAIRENGEPKFELTTLKNGVRVLSRTPAFPSHVDLGILLDLGTRDETHETSGALLSIKNTQFKTVLNTNETINYGMVQMAGGDLEMNYDQENTYWRSYCLSHDVVDIFRMMADCAIEPRSVVAANVAMVKNKHTIHLDESLHTGEEFNDTIFRTAYGLRGLGMPLKGLHHNVGNLNAYTLQRFQLENINPSRIIVCGAGVEHHGEFVALVESKLGSIPSVEGTQVRTREKTEYLGGETRNLTEANDISIALTFESVPWTNPNMAAFNVLNTIIGSCSSFSTGGPGKGMHARATKRFLNAHHFVESASGINFHFSDSGLFGLQVNGVSTYAGQLTDLLVRELRALAEPIPEEEVRRAKNILKSNIFQALERQGDVLEEGVKNLKTFGSLDGIGNYARIVDAVTGDQINSIVRDILRSKPTLIVQGGDVGRVPSLDKIHNQLQ